MSPRLTFVVDVASFLFNWPVFAEDAAPASEAALLHAVAALTAVRRRSSTGIMTVPRESPAASGPWFICRRRGRYRSCFVSILLKLLTAGLQEFSVS